MGKIIRERDQKHNSRYFMADFGLNKKALRGQERLLKGERKESVMN